jgi:hypothetical protein
MAAEAERPHLAVPALTGEILGGERTPQREGAGGNGSEEKRGRISHVL